MKTHHRGADRQQRKSKTQQTHPKFDELFETKAQQIDKQHKVLQNKARLPERSALPPFFKLARLENMSRGAFSQS